MNTQTDELIGSIVLILSGVASIAEGYYILNNPNWMLLLSEPWQSTFKNLANAPIVGGLVDLMHPSPSFMILAGIVFGVIGCAWLWSVMQK